MGKLTRRDFMVDSLFAAAMAAGAGAYPALAGEPKRKGRVVGPNDTIRMACIGVRSRGQSHVSAYAGMNDVQIATLCDIDVNVIAPSLKIIADKGKPKPEVVQDLRRVMDDPNIDAVSIATCNHWHALAAIWAMQAGKDVYVEKPVSHNVWEGRQMVEAARKYGRICQAGTQIRSTKGTNDAIAYIRAGKIGKVEVARGLCYKRRKSIGQMKPSAIPQGVDYNLWLGPAHPRPFQENTFHYNWHWLFDTGNGDLGNQGIHQMDVARWGLGQQVMPKSVVGYGGRLGYVDDGNTPNTHVAVMDYGDGTQLIFETRGLETKDYKGAMVGNVFHGTEGTLVLAGYDSGTVFDKDGKVVEKFSGGGDHFRNFIDCMRSRKVEDLKGDVYEGHVSSALCHLGNISYLLGEQESFTKEPDAMEDNEAAIETFNRFKQHLSENGVSMTGDTFRMGRKLKLNPEKENFGRNREANKLLTRDYREPFVVPKKV
jgi:predicted dehydrogenase